MLKVANFNLLDLHLVPPLRVTLFEFCEIFGIRNVELLHCRVAWFAWSYVQPFQ